MSSCASRSGLNQPTPYIDDGSDRAVDRNRWRFRVVERFRTGENFWARGYVVSTVGLDENMVRTYIRNQEDEDARYDQMKLGM